jgi:hypothetical protein
MITARMENAKYNDSLVFESVKQLVWKPAHECATKSTIINRVTFWIANQCLKANFDLSDELFVQPTALTLVPVSGLAQIALRPRSNAEAPFHTSFTLSAEI